MITASYPILGIGYLNVKCGSADEIAAYIGPKGELAVNTDTNSIHVQDGVTPGGILVGMGGGGGGLPGPPGKDGKDGKSAYELAVDEGYRGSLAEWLLSLHGQDGLDGAPGADGQDGADGAPGAPGKDGADGLAATVAVGTVSTLPAGSQATVVNAGTANAARLNFGIPQGAQGEPGKDGKDGAQGVPGVDGKSAYELAVDNGFRGTEQEWLEKIQTVLIGEPVFDWANRVTQTGTSSDDGYNAMLSGTASDSGMLRFQVRSNNTTASASSPATFGVNVNGAQVETLPLALGDVQNRIICPIAAGDTFLVYAKREYVTASSLLVDIAPVKAVGLSPYVDDSMDGDSERPLMNKTITNLYTQIYDDIGQCVSIAGAEEISGVKTFAGENPLTGYKFNSVVKGTLPAVTKNGSIHFHDSVGTTLNDLLGAVFCRVDTVGVTRVALHAYQFANGLRNYAELGVYVSADGQTQYATAPTPAASSNTNHIVTTEWIRANAVTVNGSQVINGAKKFMASPQIQTTQPGINLFIPGFEKGTISTDTRSALMNAFAGEQAISENRIGTLDFRTYKDTGLTVAGIYAFRFVAGSVENAGLQVFCSADGTKKYGTAPTPAANSNTNHIVTTEWVRSYMPAPTYSTTEQLTGATWDGYPVYRRVFKSAALVKPSTIPNVIDIANLSSWNIRYMIKCDFHVFESASTTDPYVGLQLFGGSDGGMGPIRFSAQDGSLRLVVRADDNTLWGRIMVFIMEYIKK